MKTLTDIGTKKGEPTIDSLISICFKNIGRADNAASVLIVEWLSKLFLNPANVRNNGLCEVGRDYRAGLKTAWEKFDKIPYEYHEQVAIQAFENDILSPLGLLDTED